MIKTIEKVFLFIFFTLTLLIFIINPSLITDTVNDSINTFTSSIVPSLLPFFILTDILINYNYLYYISKILKFKYSSFFLLTLFSGLPSNARNINTLLKEKQINLKEAEILLSTSFFPSIMFVIGFIGKTLLNDSKMVLKMLLIVYISNFIVFIIHYKKLSNISYSLKNEKKEFSTLLKDSIINSVEILLVILGTIIVFNIIVNIISRYLIHNKFILVFLNIILEMTSSIKNISLLNLNNKIICTFITMSLSFSGLSVLMQAKSILSNYKLNYKYVIKEKIVITLISLLLSILLF